MGGAQVWTWMIVAVLLGLLPAYIARGKGENFAGWWLFGALLFVVALPTALLIGPNRAVKRQCPACMGWVDRGASACQHCSRGLPAIGPSDAPPARTPTSSVVAIWGVVLCAIFLCLVMGYALTG
jgi:hypothetical protein